MTLLDVERVMKVRVRRESDGAELVGVAANEKRSFGFERERERERENRPFRKRRTSPFAVHTKEER